MLNTTAPIAFLDPDAVLGCFSDLSRAPVAELRSPVRTREITRLRHEAMWLMRQLSSASFEQIGRLLGNRDIHTAIVAINQTADRISIDSDYRARMRGLRDEILLWLGDAPAPRGNLSIAAACGVLADAALSDSDARIAALQLLRPTIAAKHIV